MSETIVSEPTVDDLERANVQGQYDELARQFEELSEEWNRLNDAIDLNAVDAILSGSADRAREAKVARELRQVGERMIVLKRTLTPDPLPGYNPGGGAR